MLFVFNSVLLLFLAIVGLGAFVMGDKFGSCVVFGWFVGLCFLMIGGLWLRLLCEGGSVVWFFVCFFGCKVQYKKAEYFLSQCQNQLPLPWRKNQSGAYGFNHPRAGWITR